MSKLRRLFPALVFLAAMAGTFVLGQAIRQRQPFDPSSLPAPTLPEPPPIPEDIESPNVFVSPERLVARLEDPELRLVDARSSGRCAEERIAGSACGDVEALAARCVDAADLLNCVRRSLGDLGLDGSETVVLYGEGGEAEDHLGLGRLYWWMDWAGVAEIEILYDGAEGWRRIGGPVEQGGSSPTPADFTAAPRLAPAATAEWVYEQFGPGGAQALDLRDGVDWTTVGYRAPEVFSAGHIPYALPYDVRSWLDGGRWPTPREGWGRFLELGPREGTYLTPGTEIVLYGEGPETDQLGLAYLLLRHMGIDVRVFAGGWDEWTADPDRPVVRVASAAEVAEALGELVHREVGATAPMPFYDLREVRDHGRGYLPGSEVLPWPDFPSGLEASLEQTWSGIDRRMTPIVLYCYGRDCIRSWEASVVAARSGFLDIRWLREGVEGWDAAGLPLWVDEGASGAGSDP